jgi:hypothetical protein
MPRKAVQQTSQLLPLLLSHLDENRRLNVLEVGRAVPETVDFFSDFNCRIHVVDLYSALRSGDLDSSGSGKTLQKQFQDLFAFEAGTVLDICLLWDLPHYLNEKQLRAFSAALWPWLDSKSRAHGFGVHSAATILLNRDYGIVDIKNLTARQGIAPQLKNSPHPQSFLGEWLTCFAPSRAVLLADGKIEMVMHSTV